MAAQPDELDLLTQALGNARRLGQTLDAQRADLLRRRPGETEGAGLLAGASKAASDAQRVLEGTLPHPGPCENQP